MSRKTAALAGLVVLALSAPALAASEGGDHGAPHAPEINWTTGLFDLSHQSKDADGGELEPGEAPMNPPFLAMIINFAIFIGLLVWKAGPPISRYLSRRHDEVKGALAESARMQKEAAEILRERERKLGEVDAEVDELIAGMKRDAESEKERMIEDAETASRALRHDAEERVAASTTRARQAIEIDVITAACDAAEELIREHANDDDHNNLVERFIQSLTDGTFDGGSSPPPPSSPPPETSPPETSDIDEGWS